jgi:hypothetical protein
MSERTNVLRADERLALIQLPALKGLEKCAPGEGDVLVTCAGFEDRAFEYLRRAVARGAHDFKIVAIEYRPSVGENRVQEVADLGAAAGARIQWITYDRELAGDPSQVVLSGVQAGQRLLIEVSGMSRLLIVQLISAALKAGGLDKCSIVYAEAAEYPPSEAEVAAVEEGAEELFGIIQFVSSGVFDIIVPPELSTVAMYGQPIRLIAFPTFNPTQLAALCAEINAASYTIIHGESPREENKWRTAAIRQLNRIDGLREREEETSSTLDYRETVKLLVNTYRRVGDRDKLVIAPTGSKMQSVAVAIAVAFMHDIQVVYPAPRTFQSPQNYTRGVRQMYCLDLSGILRSGASTVSPE